MFFLEKFSYSMAGQNMNKSGLFCAQIDKWTKEDVNYFYIFPKYFKNFKLYKGIILQIYVY